MTLSSQSVFVRFSAEIKWWKHSAAKGSAESTEEVRSGHLDTDFAAIRVTQSQASLAKQCTCCPPDTNINKEYTLFI